MEEMTEQEYVEELKRALAKLSAAVKPLEHVGIPVVKELVFVGGDGAPDSPSKHGTTAPTT